MFARLIVIAVLGAGCGRLGFDDLAVPDGVPPPRTTVAVYEVTIDSMSRQVEIAPIDPSRTLVLCDYRTGASSSGKIPACHLTSPTTVAVTVGVVDPSVTVRLQVIELPTGTVVQRGDESVGSGDSVRAIALQPVDLASSFAVISRWTSIDVSGLDPRYSFAAQLADPETLELRRTDTGNTVHVAWQVVQLAGARVRSGLTTIPASDVSASILLPGLDPARALVVLSSRVNSSNEAEYLTRAPVTDGTVTLIRNAPGSELEVAWFAVEPADVTVQHGATSIGSVLSRQIPLSPVDPTRTAVFLTASGGRAGNASDLDDTACTGTVKPTELELLRNPSTAEDVGAVVSWNVVQWP